MRTKTEQILAVMNVVAWIVFIGLLIKAGAILVSFGISLWDPEELKNLYMDWDLSPVRQFSLWQYISVVTLMVAITLLQASIAYLVIKILMKIKLASPFKIEIAKMLESISYTLLGTWVIVLIYDAHIKWLSKKVIGLEENYISGDFIFIAGVVFVISQIFRKGVELQSESELTV